MGTGTKVLLALCAVVGLYSLIAVLTDPRSPMGGTLVAMVLVAASLHPRVRQLGRRDNKQ
jgi:hypothetical protein